MAIIRSPHNKENPYLQVSKEMLRDKSISAKAKGVLCYILLNTDTFAILHSQIQKGLNIGEASLNSALKELLENGYISKTVGEKK